MIDFGALFSQLASGFWWLLPLLVLAALFKLPWFKGFIGEVMVNTAVRLFLNKNDYHLIKNITIQNRSSKGMGLSSNSITQAWQCLKLQIKELTLEYFSDGTITQGLISVKYGDIFLRGHQANEAYNIVISILERRGVFCVKLKF